MFISEFRVIFIHFSGSPMAVDSGNTAVAEEGNLFDAPPEDAVAADSQCDASSQITL